MGDFYNSIGTCLDRSVYLYNARYFSNYIYDGIFHPMALYKSPETFISKSGFHFKIIVICQFSLIKNFEYFVAFPGLFIHILAIPLHSAISRIEQSSVHLPCIPIVGFFTSNSNSRPGG